MRGRSVAGAFTLFICLFIGQYGYGQKNREIPKFGPVYFSQNSDTIEQIYLPRLDSIGRFLETDTSLMLQFHAYGNPLENPFYVLLFNRAKKILDYLSIKYKIRTRQQILTNANKRDVAMQESWNFSEDERAKLRKVEFIILRSEVD